MPKSAIGAKVTMGDTDMNYVVFGKGTKPLVILPGLSDGITTVYKKERVLASYYRIFAKDFKVYIFSRKNNLPTGYTTKDMADDLKKAMDMLGISGASVFGVSQGGMIAQHLAINHPDAVSKLVLGVTISKPNDVIKQVISSWIGYVKADDYKTLSADMIEKTYTEKTAKKYKPMYPIIAKINRPKDKHRFYVQANACITHDAYDKLKNIQCPTLVLGGAIDNVVGRGTSQEIAEQIENSTLIMYDDLGHGAYEETKEFNKEILKFITD